MLSSNLKQEAPLHFNPSVWDRLSLMCLSIEMIPVLKIRLIQAEKQQDKFFTSYPLAQICMYEWQQSYFWGSLQGTNTKVDSVLSPYKNIPLT